jgi:peptidoglycan lytic transglycosylase
MTGVLSVSAGRLPGDRFARKCNLGIRVGGALLVAVLIMCACIGDAHANSDTATVSVSSNCSPPAHPASVLAAAKCSTQGVASRFDNPPTLALLNVRTGTHSLSGMTGRFPTLNLHVSLPKPMLLTSLAPLSAPEPEPAATAPAPVLDNDGLAPAMIVGIASTYDPTGADKEDSSNLETASGELYDNTAWTAAIQIDLRGRFGGVRWGKNYKPVFALVETATRRVIVKINDVGPLAPGRIIDLNVKAMRYFDPRLELGLLHGVRVTPLPGVEWTTGPVDGDDSTILVGSAGP